MSFKLNINLKKVIENAIFQKRMESIIRELPKDAPIMNDFDEFVRSHEEEWFKQHPEEKQK